MSEPDAVEVGAGRCEFCGHPVTPVMAGGLVHYADCVALAAHEAFGLSEADVRRIVREEMHEVYGDLLPPKERPE